MMIKVDVSLPDDDCESRALVCPDGKEIPLIKSYGATTSIFGQKGRYKLVSVFYYDTEAEDQPVAFRDWRPT